MVPSSENLEEFFERIKVLDKALTKLKDAEVSRADLVQEIKAVSKEWMRLSQGLRQVESMAGLALSQLDSAFETTFQSTMVRTRANAYKKRLAPVIASYTDSIVIPLIRYEGSPTQVATRQVMAEFGGKVSSDELAYLDEAVRCLGSRCNRAAIILLWAAAISRLHSSIERIGFNTYNSALDATTNKKGNPFSRVSKAHVASLPDLQRSRDWDLIVVGMDLWKYDFQVYEELDRLLGIRNNAAHPGMLKPTALDVQQYASKLATYVFDTVPLGD